MDWFIQVRHLMQVQLSTVKNSICNPHLATLAVLLARRLHCSKHFWRKDGTASGPASTTPPPQIATFEVPQQLASTFLGPFSAPLSSCF